MGKIELVHGHELVSRPRTAPPAVVLTPSRSDRGGPTAVTRSATAHDGAASGAEAIAEKVASTYEQTIAAEQLPDERLDGSLPPNTRAALERALGYNFAAVRVHHGPEADAAAAALGARAFNIGPHIVMGGDSAVGDPRTYARTLTHEAIHVAQRGLATPIGEFASRSSVQPIGGLPSVLLQRSAAVLNPRWLAPMKKLIKDTGLPQVSDVAARLNLSATTPQRIRTETVDNVKHHWEVTLQFVTGAKSQTDPIADRRQGQDVIHGFDVKVGFQFASWDPRDANVPASVGTDPKQQGLYLAATALYHELSHVVLIMDGYLKAHGISPIGLSGAYDVVTQAAGSRAFGPVKTDLLARLADVGRAANADLKLGRSATDITGWASRSYDKLVQEKFVFAATEKQFATAPRDKSIAMSYVLRYVEDLIGDPQLAPMMVRRLQANPNIDALINQAAGASERLFGLINQILQPAPAAPGAVRTPPLGIGGKPLQPWP